MLYKYWVECFERELVIEFEESSAKDIEAVEKEVNDAYLRWHDVESIEDKEYREYVEASCLEEYIVECLENMGCVIKSWETIEG